MADCLVAKAKVAGSNPVFRSIWSRIHWRNPLDSGPWSFFGKGDGQGSDAADSVQTENNERTGRWTGRALRCPDVFGGPGTCPAHHLATKARCVSAPPPRCVAQTTPTTRTEGRA